LPQIGDFSLENLDKSIGRPGGETERAPGVGAKNSNNQQGKGIEE
jgi:hypothetical protein